MSTEHPSEGTLAAFIAAQLSAEENQGVVRHLLTGCQTCRKITGELWPPAGASPLGELSFRRVAKYVGSRMQRVEQERADATALLEELAAHPFPRQVLLVQNSARFQTWPLCNLVVEQAFLTGFSDPTAAVERAQVGVALAESLPTRWYRSELVADMRARAWAVLGNAQRVAGELREADACLAKACDLVEHGTGDLLEEGRIHYLQALLRHGQRRFGEALRLFSKAASSYRRAGDTHLVGEVLSDRGRALCVDGQLNKGTAVLREALALLDPNRNPRAILVAKHNLSLYLQECGESEEALRLLTEIVPLHAKDGRPLDHLRLRWLEGRVATAQGASCRAEEALEEVREEFARQGMAYDAALASLDLAVLYFRQGRTDALKKLAAGVVVVFELLEVHRETLAAALLFKHAVEAEQVSLRLLGELVAYFRRAQENPTLSFTPSAT